MKECTPGRFGTNCASTCHCHENSTTPCDKITGVCEGDCEAGYMGEDCQTRKYINSFCTSIAYSSAFGITEFNKIHICALYAGDKKEILKIPKR